MSDRKVMVTRTITTRRMSAVFLNTDDNSTFEKIVDVNAKLSDKGVQKFLKSLETDNTKFVYVKSEEMIEALYGMTLEKFIENADILSKNN